MDHYDYMVQLVGIDHVAIGTDTSIGDMVGVGQVVMGRTGPTPAPYLNGLESPADGKNIVRGLISHGYSDEDVKKDSRRKRAGVLPPDYGVNQALCPLQPGIVPSLAPPSWAFMDREAGMTHTTPSKPVSAWTGS